MTFLVHTYGCQMNVRDSEAVEALMLAAGIEQVPAFIPWHGEGHHDH